MNSERKSPTKMGSFGDANTRVVLVSRSWQAERAAGERDEQSAQANGRRQSNLAFRTAATRRTPLLRRFPVLALALTALALAGSAGSGTGPVAQPVAAAFPGANGKLAFASDRVTPGNPAGDLEIFTMNPDGAGLNQLTYNTANDTDPAWSADGNADRVHQRPGRQQRDLHDERQRQQPDPPDQQPRQRLDSPPGRRTATRSRSRATATATSRSTR